jgi:hypothetical protein
MPSRALHLDQARRNLDAIEHLLTKDAAGPRQWAVVAAFYCALHCVEAHFAATNQHHHSHADRRHTMANGPTSPPVNVYTAYGILENQAYQARYDMLQFSRAEVDQLIKNYLTPVRGLIGLS